MSARASAIVDALFAIDPMADLPRTGWLLRGVRPCESIADHSFGVAFVTMLLVDALRAEGVQVDGESALRMALVHDVPEALTGDIPMPQKSPAISSALRELESSIVERILPIEARQDFVRAEARNTLEARIVKAADKIQMMVKASVYERQKRGDLEEFWQHPKNFDALGLEVASAVFAEIASRAGRRIPTSGAEVVKT